MQDCAPGTAVPPVQPSPPIAIELVVDAVPPTLWLKLESYSPHGSIKGRTAVALWEDVAPLIDPRIGIIESTSGNLGLALAAARQVPFTAVIDPRISASVVGAMRALRARVVVMDRPDGAGGYLLSRLAYIREQVRTRPRLVWPNQYENAANPWAHAVGTAPELWAQVPRQASVLVAVSTGGTLTGFRMFVEKAQVPWELTAVDIDGSAALGQRPRQRVLSGIGASRPSGFLPQGHIPAVCVATGEAVSGWPLVAGDHRNRCGRQLRSGGRRGIAAFPCRPRQTRHRRCVPRRRGPLSRHRLLPQLARATGPAAGRLGGRRRGADHLRRPRAAEVGT